jgi:hypothetical protein
MRQYLYFCTSKASTFVPAGEVADLVQARLRLVGGMHLRVALGSTQRYSWQPRGSVCSIEG